MVDRELLGGCLDCVGLGLSVTHKIFQLIVCFGHNQKKQNVAEAVGNGGGGGGGGGEKQCLGPRNLGPRNDVLTTGKAIH